MHDLLELYEIDLTTNKNLKNVCIMSVPRFMYKAFIYLFLNIKSVITNYFITMSILQFSKFENSLPHRLFALFFKDVVFVKSLHQFPNCPQSSRKVKLFKQVKHSFTKTEISSCVIHESHATE